MEFAAHLTAEFGANNVELQLLKGATVVATAKGDDAESPSGISLIYRETVAALSSFTFQLSSTSNETIKALAMQLGIQVYGGCYGPVGTTAVV